MLNADVIDLYSLVDVGTKIIVLPNYNNVAAFDAADVAPGTLDDLRPSNITKRSRSEMRTRTSPYIIERLADIFMRSEGKMKPAGILLAVVLLGTVGVTGAMAECQIADAKLEEAILNKPDLRGPANTQIVRDLRNLRDAAFTLWSYGRHDDCERLLGNIRELLAGPPMGNLGDNDEEAADKQIAAREPKVQRGAEQGRRGWKDAKPLMRIDELAPGLRADQIIGMEVRSSDDKIVGEVRNIVFGTKDRRDYAIVASGGFFTPGKDSIVVPIQSLKVSQERVSFFLPISKETMTKVPLMPDQDYKWLSDKKWRAHNDAIFRGK
jgi:sporulation protein YlmC with PRC-barrel domain